MADHKDIVFVLDANDTFLHVGLRDQYLPHAGVTRLNPDISRVQAYEIYDSTGLRVKVDNPTGRQPELVADTTRVRDDNGLLCDRIRAALANIQVRIDRSSDPDFRVPVIHGTLPVMLAALVEAYGPLRDPMAPIQPDQQYRLHNESHP
jgi:hypothetical protein